MRTSNCFATGGSKMENKPFVGFTAIDISDGISCKFRIAKIASTFTAEALAIGDRLDIMEKIDSKQTFVIFSDTESVLQGISNTSHIIQMLKDKIERLKSRGEKIQFYWIPGHCGVKLIRDLTRRQGNQLKKGKIIKYYYQWQILKSSGKRKAKRSFTISVKTPKGTKEKATLKGTTGMARLRSSSRYV
jgi:hypothetical protein